MAPSAPPHAAEASQEDASTKERLLAATEVLLAGGGLEALSMRAVTQAAGVSVSAANYHFGSKEALLRATLLRALGPLGTERLERLEALQSEARARAATPSVESLIEAFLRPAFVLRSRQGNLSYRLLWVRLHLGTSSVVQEVKRELLNPAFQRYVDALALALPDRDRAGLALSFQLALGSVLHVLGGHAEDLADTAALEDEVLIDRLIRFSAAGIREGTPRVAGGSS